MCVATLMRPYTPGTPFMILSIGHLRIGVLSSLGTTSMFELKQMTNDAKPHLTTEFKIASPATMVVSISLYVSNADKMYSRSKCLVHFTVTSQSLPKCDDRRSIK